MEKLRIGVLGIGRGRVMMKYCKADENAELVAICDKWEEGLEKTKRDLNNDKITYYTDFNEFIKHDMDVVMLANYANQHAPFAIAAMEAGKHVISEVLPAQCMAEAVGLVECVKRTGKKYCYAENYAFMAGPREMRKKIAAGEIGAPEYAEGEYVHNCEPAWHELTQGNPNHWRNSTPAFFYCTHSFGPLRHMTGLRPVRVMGFELPHSPRAMRMGRKGGGGAIELVTMENGMVCKSLHGNMDKDSVWYSIYGSMGQMETARTATQMGGCALLYHSLDEAEGVGNFERSSYRPVDELSERGAESGHGGSDYVCLFNALEHFRGKEGMDIIDVYEGLEMWMAGHFAYLSVIENAVQEIPNLRDPAMLDKYRNDRRCCDPSVASDQLLPCYSKGNPDIPAEVYEKHRLRWEERQREKAEQEKAEREKAQQEKA